MSYKAPTTIEQAQKIIQSKPVQFIENKGQMKGMNGKSIPNVLFKAEANGMDLYITDKGLTYVFIKVTENEKGISIFSSTSKNEKKKIDKREDLKVEWSRIDMFLKGALIKRENIIREEKSNDFKQYFMAHCPNGISDVYSYGRITIKNIYPNIDWVFYNSSEKGFKYDFILHPGADPNQIEIVYNSNKQLRLDKEGNVQLKTEIGTLTENSPISYFDQKEVQSYFVLSSLTKNDLGGIDSHVNFSIHGVNNPIEKGDLIIDPQLTWATFYGGSSSEGAMSICTDQSNNIFIAGYSSSIDFPTDDYGSYFQGVFIDEGLAYFDGIIMKLSNSGEILWSTYYGGSGDEVINSIATDQNGNVFATGRAYNSIDLPLEDAGTFFQETNSGVADIFILKFDNLGNRLWATYYGGGDFDEAKSICTDDLGNIFITGFTLSNDLPIQDAGTFFQDTYGGAYDAFILKFDNLGNRLLATYYGGEYTDEGGCITKDNFGNIVFIGYTNSVDFPTQNAGSFFQENFAGGSNDAFIVKFDNLGNRVWSTYYGGSAQDDAGSILCDSENNLFIIGSTSSTDFPVQDAGTFFQDFSGASDEFILKFDNLGNRIWSTYYGGTDVENYSGNDNIAMDSYGNVYVSFVTYSDFVFTQPPCNGNGGYYDDTHNGGPDIFITQFSNTGELFWATYLGGDATDFRGPIVIDAYANLFVTGEWAEQFTQLNSATYPTIEPGGTSYFDETANGIDDIFMAKFINIPLPLTETFYFVSDTVICFGDSLELIVNVPNATYLWQDNSIDSTYLAVDEGLYWVDVSTNGCIYRDSIQINYGGSQLFSLGNDTSICQEFSIALEASIPDATYLWQDGSTTPTFIAIDAGNYWVQVSDECGVKTDSITINNIEVPVLNLGNDVVLCNDTILELNALISGATNYLWQDGTNESIYTATEDGIYWVQVSVNNCSVIDSIKIEYNIANFIDLGNDTVLCEGDLLELDLPSSNLSFVWNDGSTENIQLIANEGFYWVDITSNNCTIRDSIYINYNPLPIINLGDDFMLCEYDTYILDVTTSDATYLWQDNSVSPSFTVSGEGQYWVTITINNCKNTDSVDVIYNPLPIYDFGSDKSLCYGEIYDLSTGITNANYLWQDNSEEPIYSVSQQGIYWAEVNLNNCTYTDTIFIDFEKENCYCEIFIPNTFTPNSDGLNDLFKAISNCQLNDFSLTIFNRWGEIIYTSDNTSEGWNGSLNGYYVPNGIYIWNVKSRVIDQVHYNEKYGTINLIR